MFPSSTSSSSQGSIGPTPSGISSGGGLMRYGSAPGSLLKTAVDSVIGANHEFSALGNQNQIAAARFFRSEASESSSKPNLNDSYSISKNLSLEEPTKTNTAIGLQRPYEFPDGEGGGHGGASSSLVRHSSSPAGFLNQLAGDNGFSITRGVGSSYNNPKGISRLNSQLSFTQPKESGLSRISEEAENVVDTENGQIRKSSQSNYGGFGNMGSWDDHTFSVAPNKRVKTHVVNINDLDAMESQFQFGMPQSSLEMSNMDKLLNIPHDSVPCKIRAKRGCATHPRSIAERERRTRISGKLKKLQDLVPNMDKQTSYADMLDLAVQHIKVLQNQVHKLKKEVNDCTCGGCKKTTDL